MTLALTLTLAFAFALALALALALAFALALALALALLAREARPTPQIIELGDEGGSYRVSQVLWNDDVLYAIASANWHSPFEDLAGACAQEVRRALYRLNGLQWELVDHGPIERVWPVGPEDGHKMVQVLEAASLSLKESGAEVALDRVRATPEPAVV